MRIVILLALVLLAYSCEVKVGTDEKKEEKKSYSRNKNKIRNGIEFQTTGDLKVEQAFLTYADDGTFVSEENITELNRPLKLNLVLDGWKASDERVYLGARQRVTLEDEEIMDIPDLFEQNNINSISEKDARFITLDVVITKINRLADNFQVEFRVWNKNADQEVKGTYKFYINEM